MMDLNDSPATFSDAAELMQADIALVRDIARGTSHIRRQAAKYLPRHPQEDHGDYRSRLMRPGFFNAFTRSIEGLVGMVFRRDPVLGDDVPKEIRAQAESIDDSGTHFAVFAKEVFADVLAVGHAGILVDAPVVKKRLSLGEERALGIRPFWVHVKADDIVSWRTTMDSSRELLSQLVLREVVLRPKGEFTQEAVELFRIYRREITKRGPVVTWQLVDVNDRNTVEVLGEGTVKNVTEIPFAPIYARKTGFLTSIPPLIDLVHTNISHYQVLADHLHALHKASVPILVLRGVAIDEGLKTGPNTAILLPDSQSKAEYIEHSGNALGATRQQLIDFKGDMSVLGLSMLQHETRAAETAEAKRLDQSTANSALATAARSMQDGLESALGYHARMLKLPEGGSVIIDRSFETKTLTASEIDTYSKMVALGHLSIESLWGVLLENDALPDDFDPEVEADRLANPSLGE